MFSNLIKTLFIFYLFEDLSEVQSNYIIYLIQGAIAIAGAAVQWLRDNIGIIEKSSDIGKFLNKAHISTTQQSKHYCCVKYLLNFYIYIEK